MTTTAPRRIGARELLDLVVDDGTFLSWDTPAHTPGADENYRAELAAAAEKSGADESILSGEGRVGGRRVALIVSEFRFLAGSIGRAAADRICAAIERATAEGLPLLAGPASGGTRMQEGTPAFVAMIRITAAIERHRASGLPYLVYLRHPTTGGVMASWGSLGHVTVGEPGALLGFLGPRVYEALYGLPFPDGIQSAENLVRHGLIDAVAEPEQLGALLARALDLLTPDTPSEVAEPETAALRPDAADPWASIERSRDPRRPDVRWLLEYGADDVLPLSGTGQGENDPAILLALARFGSMRCVVIGHQRPRPGHWPAMGPGSLREAQRGIALAEELGLPLVSVIDTAGADLSPAAEEGGLAGEIARCLRALIAVDTPVVSVLLGQGTGGGALALLPADITIAAENAWLSPLPPEGASAIVHRTTERAPELAAQQRVGVAELWTAGIIDHLVDERPDARAEPREFSRRVAAAIQYELHRAAALGPAERHARRQARFDAF